MTPPKEKAFLVYKAHALVSKAEPDLNYLQNTGFSAKYPDDTAKLQATEDPFCTPIGFPVPPLHIQRVTLR